MIVGGVVNDVKVANDRALVHCAPSPLTVPISGSAIARSSSPSSDHVVRRLLACLSTLTSSRPFATAASTMVSRDSAMTVRASRASSSAVVQVEPHDAAERRVGVGPEIQAALAAVDEVPA